MTRASSPAVRAVAAILSLLLPVLLPLPAALTRLAFPPTTVVAAAPTAISDQASFEAWLAATGRPLVSRYLAYRASYDTFARYGLLVYGTPGLVPGNRYDIATNQYAKLGFSYDEFTVTNTYFPADAPAGTALSTPWDWSGPWNEIALGTDAAVSWMRLSAREKEHVKVAVLSYSGKTYGGMTFVPLGLTEANTIVLSPPSWSFGFAIFTRHYWRISTNLRYATFTGQGIGHVDIACLLAETSPTAEGVYRLPAGSDRIRIPIRATGTISAYGGLARPGDVSRLGVETGAVATEGAGATSRSVDGSFEVTRDMMKGAASASFSVSGTAWAVSMLGDTVCDTDTLAVTVLDEAAEESPILSLSIVGAIGYFRGQTDLLGRRVPLDPMRFLGLETVTVTAVFRSRPERVLFEPCDELQAAVYMDPEGNRYDVADFTGTTLRFPEDFQVVPAAGATTVSFHYTLPLAPSTCSWEGLALRAPYSFQVVATYPARTWTARLGGIGMTGDVFDLLYLQPD